MESWHSPLLVFRDSQLEREFMAQFTGRGVDTDKVSSILHVIMVVVLLICMVFRNRVDPSRGYGMAWLSAVAILNAIVHAIWVHRASRGTCIRWRTAAVTLTRSIIVMVGSVGSMVYFDTDLIIRPASCWGRLIFNTGILSAAWPAFAFPLLFKHHVVLLTVLVIVQMKILAARFCGLLVLSDQFIVDEARRLAPELCMAGTTESGSSCKAFSCIDQLSGLHDWLSAATGLICREVGLDALTAWTAFQPECACKDSVVFLQLTLGWWLPTMVLYYWERHFRKQFLMASGRANNEEQFLLEVERELARSMSGRDCTYRIIHWLIVFMRSLWWLFLIWMVLVLLL